MGAAEETAEQWRDVAKAIDALAEKQINTDIAATLHQSALEYNARADQVLIDAANVRNSIAQKLHGGRKR